MLTFTCRYVFKGSLTLTTALHIGGGESSLSPTDSPVIRGPDLKPFIPGSSLKGAFRSTVEKLSSAVPSLKTCALDKEASCPGAPESEAQSNFNRKRREGNWSEAQLVNTLEGELCDTCKLFGSPFCASKIYFDDLALSEWPGTTQIRDGVAIDRDSERARDRLKYDYEVVPSDSTFHFRVTLEEPTNTDLQLTCLGLSEFLSGFAALGGNRSRGLGRCILEELHIYELDLRDQKTRIERLSKYLLGKELDEKMTRLPDAEAFLQTQIGALLGKEE